MGDNHAHFRALDYALLLTILLAAFGQVRPNCPAPYYTDYSLDVCVYKNLIEQSFDQSMEYCKEIDGVLSSSSYIYSRADLSTVWWDLGYISSDPGLQNLNLPSNGIDEDDKKPEPRKCDLMTDFVLGPEDCDQKHASLCERQSATCPKDWIPVAGDCVKISPDSKPWEEALDDCKAMNARPLTIPTDRHAEKIRDYLNKQTSKMETYWTGAKKHADSRVNKWDDGRTVENFPHLQIGNEDKDVNDSLAYCGSLHASVDQSVLEMTTSCKVHRKYLCFLAGNSPDPEPFPRHDPHRCSDGFGIKEDTCFWKSDSPATWAQASDICQAKGAKLYIAPTEDEKYNLLDILDDRRYWVGLTRQDSEPFKWLDDTEEVIGPEGTENQSENARCMLAKSHTTSISFWSSNCDNLRYFVCQKDQVPVPDQGDCGDGWEARPGTDTCYYFLDKDQEYVDRALGKCRRLGATLASIKNREEGDYIRERFRYMTESTFWIGLQQTESKGWHWSDGTPFAYMAWGQDAHKRNVVAKAARLSKLNMTWEVSEEEFVYGAAVCEKHLNEQKSPDYTTPTPKEGLTYQCDAGWSGFEDHCYFFSKGKRTWQEARAVCEQEGADLATIQNQGENDFIFQELPSGCSDKHPSCDELEKSGHCVSKPLFMGGLCPKACSFCDGDCSNKVDDQICNMLFRHGNCDSKSDYMMENCRFTCGCDTETYNGFWIGLRYQNLEQQYRWANTTEIKFTDWSVNEPGNYEGINGGCAAMMSQTGQWASTPCNIETVGFVCQKPKSFTETDDKIEDPAAIGCPAGSRGYESKCYTIKTKQLSWEDAKTDCEENQERLAVIPNRNVDEFLESELLKLEEEDSSLSAWIGLYYNGSTSVWIDGSVLDYRPMIILTMEDGMCATESSDKTIWYATPCTGKYSYICESDRAKSEPDQLPAWAITD